MKAVGYTRVSTRGQAFGDGPRRQREAIIRWAEENDVELIDIVEEKPMSGVKSVACRPGLTRALQLIQESGAEVLVAEATDRLSRSVAVAEELHGRLAALGARTAVTSKSEAELLEQLRRLFA